MSRLTKLSLRNRSIVGLVVIAVLIFGVIAISSLKEELIPDLTFPYLTVFTSDQGTSATDVERTITTPLEQALDNSAGIKEYDSFSNEGASIITIEYEFGTDMKAKESEIQQLIAGVQLPPTAVTPNVAALNFGAMPVVQLAVFSSLPPQELADLLTTKVVPRLQGIDGVQAVTLTGVQQMELQIKLRPKAVARYGITPTQIMTAVTQANLTTGAGSVTSGSLVYPVTVTASTKTIAAFKRLVLTSDAAVASGGASTAGAGGGGAGAGATSASAASSAAAATSATSGTPAPAVTLGQIADIRVAAAPLTAVTRTDGRPTIGISVSKSSAGNTVNIAADIARELPAITRDLHGQAKITTVVDQSVYIKESISSLWREGLIGAAFAVLVIWAFLRSWRSTLIASLSIPLSVVGALVILYSRGNSLNMLTLGGLTIAIGRVIDDSIVVIENTYRHLQEGDDIRTAAYTGTREVAGAITASTLTTVAVFMPLGFIHGLASEFFRPFALTVTFALLCSLFVALMVVPVVATWVLSKRQVGHRDADDVTRLQRLYLPALKLALDHKAVTLTIAVTVFVGTMALTPLLKTNLFDSSAQNTMSITQSMPAGTSLDATMAAAAKVENVLKSTKGVDIYQVTGGSTGSLFGAGGGTSASAAQASFAITTDPDLDKNAVVDDVRQKVAGLDGVGTVTVTGEDSGGGMGGMSQMEVRVSASDPAVLKKASDAVLAQMKTVDGLANVTSNLSEGRPSATVTVNQQKAAAAGVSPTTLSAYLSLLFNGMPLGVVPTTSGPLTAQIMVGTIRLPPIPGAVSALLTRIPVPGAHGMVPLSQVATVTELKSPVQVTHVDGARTASVTASVTNNNIGAATTNITKALDKITLPEGATWSMAGASQATNDVFRTLGISMLIAILLVYLIMVATFRSLLDPLILLISIPFAAVGAVIALVVTGTALGMPSLIGLLMLIGIVVTNAIVLLDLVEQFRRRGMDARAAVVEGGRRRLRPILMTAVATILALVPMALGIGGKSGFLSTPLAVVVIGGLFTSTALTLILVPVLYVAFARLRPAVHSEPDQALAPGPEAAGSPS